MDPITWSATSSAAGLLFARFIDLQYAPFYVKPVHFPNRSHHVVVRLKFNKSETTRAPTFPVANHSRRGYLKSLCCE
jgi:hypothetical protein